MKLFQKCILPLALWGAVLTGCSLPFEPESTSAPTEPAVTVMAEPETTVPCTTEPEPARSEQELLLEQVQAMPLSQRVGQLFIVEPADLTPEAPSITRLSPEGAQALAACPPGGLILFSENLESPEQLHAFTEELQAAASIPLFLSVDEEGGPVARLGDTPALALPRFPSAARFQGDREAVEQMGQTIGGYLKEYGFNVDFAPVADVNTNPRNPVIGKRAFSSDPVQVAQCAAAMSQGLLSQGIIPVYKHFPGHGDTRQDSHKRLAVSHRTAPEQQGCEWLPYENLSNQIMVMVGHIALPQVTGDMTPATLSRPIVTDILKTQMGFSGLVITDSLKMDAITDSFGTADAALAALNAGCDLILLPNSYQEAYAGVLAAVENGSYPEEMLNATVARILQFKIDHGMMTL